MEPRQVVLLGIGHTNLHVLRVWAKSPPPNCELVCISKFPFTTYSGMLPGVLAGQFAPAEMQIQLQPLCRRAGARLVLAEAVGLDAKTRTLHFRNAPPVDFDLLSVGVGSVPIGWSDFHDGLILPIKPMQTFIQRLDAQLSAVVMQQNRTANVTIVGGGVAGVEISLCLHRHMREQYPRTPAAIRIVDAADEIAGGMQRKSVQVLHRLLAARDIAVHRERRVTEIAAGGLVTAAGERYASDCVVWITGAGPPPVLEKLGLPTDDRGFLATEATLQSTSGLPIFAVGDSGTILNRPTPKAGVYAVRQAPVLWKNIWRMLRGQRLAEYRPQRDFLKLINTGDGRALLEYKGVTLHNRLCWMLKKRIDLKFVHEYQ